MASPPLTSRRVALPVTVFILLSLSLLPARFSVYGPPLHNAVFALVGWLSAPLHAFGSRLRPGPELTPDRTVSQYQEQVLSMEGQIRRLEHEVQRLRDENSRLSGLKQHFSRDDFDLLPARVLGRTSDALAETFTLDKGLRDGVSIGMIVVEGPYLLGRVIQAQHASSVVEGVMAKGSLLGLELAGAPGRAVPFKPRTHDLLVAEDAERKLPVKPGDLARLADEPGPKRWPDAAHHMVVGRVERVEPDPDNPLWQRIEVRPLRTLSESADVTVLVPKGRGGGESP